jgi:hypothetical protein
MKFLTLFFALGLILIACQPQTITFEQVVPSPKGALWKTRWLSTEKKAYRGYKFYQDGRCILYLVNKQGALSRYNWGDDKVSNTWSIRQDTLTINGIAIHLLRVNKDTVYLYDFHASDTLLLVRDDQPVYQIEAVR